MYIGDIYLTRNTEEVGNDTRGFWNHAAIVSRRLTVIEAQMEPNAVIEVDMKSFRDRYPEWIRLNTGNKKVQEMMAIYADRLVGNPYRRLMSVWRRTNLSSARGENCVSVVRKCFKYATGRDPMWMLPDDIAKSRYLVKRYHKKDYRNWRKPRSWFQGRIR